VGNVELGFLDIAEGDIEGFGVGDEVGNPVGMSLGSFVGDLLGLEEMGDDDGVLVGNFVTGLSVGDSLVG
jgi:hypothetical protein